MTWHTFWKPCWWTVPFACWDSYSTTSAAWFCLRVWIVHFIFNIYLNDYCNRSKSKLLTVLTQKGILQTLGSIIEMDESSKSSKLHHSTIPRRENTRHTRTQEVMQEFVQSHLVSTLNPIHEETCFSSDHNQLYWTSQTRFSRYVNDMNIYECCSEGHQFLQWNGIYIYIILYILQMYIYIYYINILLCPAGFIHITASTRRCKTTIASKDFRKCPPSAMWCMRLRQTWPWHDRPPSLGQGVSFCLTGKKTCWMLEVFLILEIPCWWNFGEVSCEMNR